MKCSKDFLQSRFLTILLSAGFFVALAGLTIGGVVIDTEEGSSQQQGVPQPKDYAKEAREGSQESYEVIPPLQDSSQLFPAYPGAAGPNMPVPPTYLNPNTGQQYLPQPPTGQTPYGQSPSGGGGGMEGITGDPMTGVRPDMMPGAPMGGGGSPMMPAAPTPGQNLNQLGVADPQYGRFESARLEASIMPHQPAQVNATRNQVIRGGKPFSGYRQPSPYSPYMSLLRTQDSLRGIDNYYEYVMPQIQQEQTNRQVSREISGLTTTARSGYEALQQVKQRPGNAPVQSAGRAPATYMNTGGYFGAGQN